MQFEDAIYMLSCFYVWIYSDGCDSGYAYALIWKLSVWSFLKQWLCGYPFIWHYALGFVTFYAIIKFLHLQLSLVQPFVCFWSLDVYGQILSCDPFDFQCRHVKSNLCAQPPHLAWIYVTGTDDDPPNHRIIRNSRGVLYSGPMRTPSRRVSHETDLADMEVQIHCIETEAYGAVLRAFIAQSDVLSWVLPTTLICFFNIVLLKVPYTWIDMFTWLLLKSIPNISVKFFIMVSVWSILWLDFSHYCFCF